MHRPSLLIMAEEQGPSEETESYESEGSQSSNDSYPSSDDEDEEPVLKYKRFAKEVVQSTCDGSEGARDVINCITVHPKVFLVDMYNERAIAGTVVLTFF